MPLAGAGCKPPVRARARAPPARRRRPGRPSARARSSFGRSRPARTHPARRTTCRAWGAREPRGPGRRVVEREDMGLQQAADLRDEAAEKSHPALERNESLRVMGVDPSFVFGFGREEAEGPRARPLKKTPVISTK